MKLPSLIITAPKVRLKEKLAEQSIQLQNETAEGNDYKTLQNEIKRIGNDWYSNPHNIHYVFFATDLDDINEKRREAVRDHVQLITSMKSVKWHLIINIGFMKKLLKKLLMLIW